MAAEGRRPLSLILLVVLLLLLVGGAGVTIFSQRRLAGSVPGRAAIVSLAADSTYVYAATAAGIWISDDGLEWKRHPDLAKPGCTVGGDGEVLAGCGRRLYLLSGEDSTQIKVLDRKITAIGAGLAATTEGLEALDESPKAPQGGPEEVSSLARREERLYAGGLSAGLWSWQAGEWTKLLPTPVTAVEFLEDGRLLLGTPGGLIVFEPEDSSFGFTDLRGAVSGLAWRDDEYLALTDRLLYRSSDGLASWAPLI